MAAINDLYLNSPCELKTLTNDLLTNAVISEIREDYIQIINHDDVLPVIHCDTMVKINVFNHKHGFVALVGKVYLSTPEFMKIIEVQSLADFERRNFFRIKLNASARAYLIEDDIPPDHNLKLFHVTISDLSLSGCFIKTKKQLKIGQRLVININLLSETSVAFCSEIQREQQVTPIVFGYGCSFLDSSSKKSDLLCSYIFEKQREQIRNMREAQSNTINPKS